MLTRFFLALAIILLGAHVLAAAVPSAPPDDKPISVDALCQDGELVGVEVTVTRPGSWRIQLKGPNPCSEDKPLPSTKEPRMKYSI